MGIIQGVWILYNIVLILNFLIVDKQTTTAKRHVIEKTAEISQPGYSKNASTDGEPPSANNL